MITTLKPFHMPLLSSKPFLFKLFKKGLCVCFLFTLMSQAQNKTFYKQLDSIQKLRKLSKNENLNLEERIDYAKRAVELSNKTKQDSVVLISDDNLAFLYLNDKKYFEESKRISHKILKLAHKQNDPISLAYANSYLGFSYNFTNKDSAYYYYYASLTAFEKIKTPITDEIVISKVMIYTNISTLQSEEQDYVSSQATIIKAINLLKTIPENKMGYDNLWNLYNSLGINLKHLQKYKKAIQYYKQAIAISNKLEDNFETHLYTKINIAEVYKATKEYKKAIKIYNNLLKDKRIESEDMSSYGAILNNSAHTLFLSGDKNHTTIDSLFKEANDIFIELDLPYELSASGNDMAEFYYTTNQKNKALYYSERTYRLAKLNREYEEFFRSLKMLSKLKEGDSGKAYLLEYIKLKDSLITNERLNRNKYARIQYETDQYIQETRRLNTQNVLISIIAGVIIIILGLLYFINKQRSKNKELLFASEHEKANQEIYKLMLKQQTSLESGRLQERHRIAEDLHDGVLSRLFGTRMGLGFLNIKGDEQTLKEYEKFIKELQKTEKEVRDVSHELKNESEISKTNFKFLINSFLEKQSLIGGFEYKLNVKNNIKFESLSESIKVEAYRIIQEATQNIIKHAQAKNVTISFLLKESDLQIKIKDNGIGFDAKNKQKGIGLKNIESRILKLKGNFKINTKFNKGTELNISIPT